MLNTSFVRFVRISLKSDQIISRLCSVKTDVVHKIDSNKYDIIDTKNVEGYEGIIDRKPEKKSVLDECTEDISHVAPYLKPAFNFAAYVNKSETLQQLVKLGVDLHRLEGKKDVPQFILGLDFEKDIKKYILLMNDLKIEDIGAFISKNPFILKEDIDNLVVRVNYLRYKRFSEDMISRIVSKSPFWLMHSTQDIDSRLGYFQKNYGLSGQEVRDLATHQPKLITTKMHTIKVNGFVLKEEMGFNADELKMILLFKPDIFMREQKMMLKTFEFAHKEMKIPLEIIAKMPGILLCREFRIKQRHLFLETLGKAQYNPHLPNYVSPLALVTGTDADFCDSIAKTSVESFNTFLKTL